MVTLQQLLELLERALADPSRRAEHVGRFQEHVWHDDDLVFADPEIEDILGDLAYDLDYYVPDVRMRSESASYYGDDRLEELIRSALRKLRASDELGD